MYINAIAHYLPEEIVPNRQFTFLNGLTDEWIVSRTGIRERRKADTGENTNSMGIQASEEAISKLPLSTSNIDLIIGATYTPHDTIFTLAHAVQRKLLLKNIPVVSISSACSSLINAIEIAEGYFALGKAHKALIVASEHNTAYSDIEDKVAGHLWGDGAVALVISKERTSEADMHILGVTTSGAATEGKAEHGVLLKPVDGGILMPHGRDVFIHACTYMAETTVNILTDHNMSVEDIDYFIPHQANYRITKRVVKELNLPEEKAITNLTYLGNTGCAGCGIALSEHQDQFQKGEHIVISVFGGGYSYGAMLIRV